VIATPENTLPAKELQNRGIEETQSEQRRFVIEADRPAVQNTVTPSQNRCRKKAFDDKSR
jgi:hypothetical protein